MKIRRFQLLGFLLLILFSCNSEQDSPQAPKKPKGKEILNAKTFYEWTPAKKLQLIEESGSSELFLQSFKINDDQIDVRSYCAKCDTVQDTNFTLSLYKLLGMENKKDFNNYFFDTLEIQGQTALQYYAKNAANNNYYELSLDDISGEGFYLSITGMDIDSNTVDFLRKNAPKVKLKIHK